MKITLRQLKILIEQYVADAEGNVTPPQQFLTSIADMLDSINFAQTLADMYLGASVSVADRQYQTYAAAKSKVSADDLAKMETMLNSGDEESFNQTLYLMDTFDLFNSDYETVSTVMKNIMLRDPRLEQIELEMRDYLSRAAMSDLIYVDDKGYKASEFLEAIVDHLTGYDKRDSYENHWPVGFARGLKRLVENPGRFAEGAAGPVFLELLGLKHLSTGVQDRLDQKSYGRQYPQFGFYPFSGNTFRLNEIFPNATQVTIGSPASREGKSEYGLDRSLNPIIFIHCLIYCDYDGSDTDVYFENDLIPLLGDYGLRFIDLGDDSQIIVGEKKNFDEAITYINQKRSSSRKSPVPAEDYDRLLTAFLDEADDSFSGGGFNRPCSGYQEVFDIYEFPGYEREARKEILQILRYHDDTLSIISDAEDADPGVMEKVMGSIMAHMNDDNSFPDWDPERNLPYLVAAISAEEELSGGTSGVYNSVASEFGDDLGQSLSMLVDRLSGEV